MRGIILQGVDNMANIKKNVVIAARIDNKGRITLPRSMRQNLGVDRGDTVFLKHDPQKTNYDWPRL
jgi:ABC-type lipoprotein release transport system permease subunit